MLTVRSRFASPRQWIKYAIGIENGNEAYSNLPSVDQGLSNTSNDRWLMIGNERRRSHVVESDCDNGTS